MHAQSYTVFYVLVIYIYTSTIFLYRITLLFKVCIAYILENDMEKKYNVEHDRHYVKLVTL